MYDIQNFTDNNVLFDEYKSCNQDESDSDFFFYFDQKILKTKGVEKKINTSLFDKDHNFKYLDEKIDDAFDYLKNRGVENPLLVGSIPFDWQSPAKLFFPREHAFSRNAYAQSDSSVPNSPLEWAKMSEVINENQFKGGVEQALKLFETTPLRKVVLSRAMDVTAHEAFVPKEIVQSLIEQNPSAYVFSAGLSDGRTLIGASPELLIRKNGKKILSNPLAGSVKRTGDADDERRKATALMNSEKDRFEHKLVVDAVEEVLAPYCAQLRVPQTPSVINTPTMMHLSTEVGGTLAVKDISSLRLAAALHPTPAVCGTPYDLAYRAIQDIEGYPREMYSGMVGWMDSHGNGEWAVTIRCGVVNERSLRLYAGAGIVPSSHPDHEWAETSAKLSTMLNAFGLKVPEDRAENEAFG